MSKALRILFLTHYFPPEGNAPASRTYETCKRWVRAGHHVTVVTCAPNAPAGVLYSGYRNRLMQRESVDGIEVVRVWTYLAANSGRIRRILNYLSYSFTATFASLFQRADIVIATTPQFFCGLGGLVASKLKRVPLVLEVRDIWPESIATVGALKSRWLLKPLSWLADLMYAGAREIVTVGDGYKQELCRRGVPQDKISVITNGVDTEVFANMAIDPAVRRRHGLTDQFVCAYVGTVGMSAGLSVAIRAGKLLKARGRHDIRLMVVGDGAEREQLEADAQRLGLDNVIFTGRREKHEIPGYIGSVDACLVHLRKKDLFRTVLPSKIFEAAGMSKPIIIGVEGFAANLVNKAQAGLCIEPENEVDLVNALERLADNPALCRQLGSDGQAYVLEHFDREKLSRNYLDILLRITASDEPELPRLPADESCYAMAGGIEKS